MVEQIMAKVVKAEIKFRGNGTAIDTLNDLKGYRDERDHTSTMQVLSDLISAIEVSIDGGSSITVSFEMGD